jgi:hypothetical protein
VPQRISGRRQQRNQQPETAPTDAARARTLRPAPGLRQLAHQREHTPLPRNSGLFTRSARNRCHAIGGNCTEP